MSILDFIIRPLNALTEQPLIRAIFVDDHVDLFFTAISVQAVHPWYCGPFIELIATLFSGPVTAVRS